MLKTLRNIHPGEVLNEEFLKPLKLAQTKVAKDIDVSPRRINEIVAGKRSITAETALRLALYFGTSEGFWMGLQDDYELEQARSKIESQLKNIHPFNYSAQHLY